MEEGVWANIEIRGFGIMIYNICLMLLSEIVAPHFPVYNRVAFISTPKIGKKHEKNMFLQTTNLTTLKFLICTKKFSRANRLISKKNLACKTLVLVV